MKRVLIIAVVALSLVLPTGASVQAQKAHRYKVKAEANWSKIISGQTVVITGRVKPISIGRKVILQKRYKKHDGKWKKVETSRVDASGRFELTDRPGTARKRWYRVVKPAGDGHRKGVSEKMKVKVKPWDGRVDVRLFWNTSTNLNLRLYDPNYETISEQRPGPSDSGGVYDPKRTTGCGDVGASERIYWPEEDAPVGLYQAYVLVPRNTTCTTVPTPWRIELRVNGRLVKTVHGAGPGVYALSFGENGHW